MISKEIALDFAKEMYGSAVKLTPCVYRFEGMIQANSAIEMINNNSGKFILVKITSTVINNVTVVIRTPKSIEIANSATPLSEINDCDDMFLPVRLLRVANNNSTALLLSVFVYGYAVE